MVAEDDLPFALFYASTGLTMAVHFRWMAAAGPWNAASLLLIPVISTAFLFYWCGGRFPTWVAGAAQALSRSTPSPGLGPGDQGSGGPGG